MNDLHDLAALYVVDALEPAESLEFERHLAGCVACQQEVRAMHAVTEELAHSVEVTPPPSLRAAILAQIAAVPQEPGPPPDVSTPPRAHRGTVRALRPAARRPRAPYLMAAAALLVAVGCGGWALKSHSDASQANRQYTAIAALLASPDVRTVSGSLSGGGTGTVVLSHTRDRAVFVAQDLPALDSGKTYELWTVTDVPAPAGTFSSGSSPAVVDLPDAALTAKRIAITIEPAGGSAQPTSPPVMSVAVPRSA